ncbi:MAG: nitrilase family protein, partial [Sediminibacterium sp.]|nr:nitrilase family protein [Sediminibacterium sp.]
LVQSDLHWEDKKKNFQHFDNLFRQIKSNTDIIILPETFNTGFTNNIKEFAEPMNGPTLEWMQRCAQQYQTVIMGSYFVLEEGNYYNRFVCVSHDKNIEYYDKKHLFPLGGEAQEASSGKERKIIFLHNWNILLSTCYDVRFPMWSCQQKVIKPEYDILINIANWPTVRGNNWRTFVSARALENQVYAIGVNRIGIDYYGNHYGGHSLVVSPTGETLIDIQGLERIETIELKKSDLIKQRLQYPFLIDSDSFKLVDSF